MITQFFINEYLRNFNVQKALLEPIIFLILYRDFNVQHLLDTH